MKVQRGHRGGCAWELSVEMPGRDGEDHRAPFQRGRCAGRRQPHDDRAVRFPGHRRREGGLAVVRVARYGRFWAVYDGDALVVVAAYERGAEELAGRLLPAAAPACLAAPTASRVDHDGEPVRLRRRAHRDGAPSYYGR